MRFCLTRPALKAAIGLGDSPEAAPGLSRLQAVQPSRDSWTVFGVGGRKIPPSACLLALFGRIPGDRFRCGAIVPLRVERHDSCPHLGLPCRSHRLWHRGLRIVTRTGVYALDACGKASRGGGCELGSFRLPSPSGARCGCDPGNRVVNRSLGDLGPSGIDQPPPRLSGHSRSPAAIGGIGWSRPSSPHILAPARPGSESRRGSMGSD